MTTTGHPDPGTSTAASTSGGTTAATQPVPWVVQDAPVPSSLDADDAWAVHGGAALDAAVQRAARGHDDLARTATEILAALGDQQYARRLHLVATRPDRPREVVGAAHLLAPLVSNGHLAEVELLVHPDHRRRGVGTALLAAAQERARALGRRTLLVQSDHGPEPAADHPDAMAPPTGAGRIARTDAFARFAERHDLVLEQAERYSVLTLPVPADRLERLRAEAAGAAGPDHRVVAWQDRCPDEWVDQLAVLTTRMSTDAPRAGLEIEEDPWDAARVRDAEARAIASGYGSLHTAVVHVPSGTLAGFTVLECPRDHPEFVFQGNTLVLREHRGRRLGQLVKAVNLQRLAERQPQARRVHTWNAEENSHMLRINVALGFRPAGVCGVWTKDLA